MADPVVTRLGTTAIKGLRMTEPPEIELTAGGAIGDRAFVLVGPDDGIRSVTLVGALLRLSATFDPDSDQLEVRSDDGRRCAGAVRLGESVVAKAFVGDVPCHEVLGPWSAFISDAAGKPLRLLKIERAGDGSDLAPVTLLGDGSLAELARRVGQEDLDPRRFRMLIQIGPCAPHAEDGWQDRTLTIGDVRLRVGATVPRCAATTRHPERGDRDVPVVRAIRDYRGIHPTGWGNGVPFGVYAEVLTGGRVRVGDSVRVGASAT